MVMVSKAQQARFITNFSGKGKENQLTLFDIDFFERLS
jgi:hypothetical protein